MENIPPGDYAIIATSDLIIENNVLVRGFNLYPSFSICSPPNFHCLNYAISVRPNTITKFTMILSAPGLPPSFLQNLIGVPYEPRELYHFREEDGTLEYMLLNKHNYENLLVKEK